MKVSNQRLGLRVWVCTSLLLVACGGDDDSSSDDPMGGSGGSEAGSGGSEAGSGGSEAGSGGSEAGSGGSEAGSGGEPMAGTGGDDAGTDAGTDSGEGDPCEDVDDPCSEEGTSCDGDELVTCAEDENGCLVETRTDCTEGETDFCDEDASPPACAADPCADVDDLCSEAGTSCDGTTLVVCAEDDNGCLVETRTDCTDTDTCGDAGDEACNRCDAALETPACIFDPCATEDGEMKQDICAVNETMCAEDILVTCVADSEGCLIATPLDCETAEVCGESGDEACNACDGEAEPPSCVFDPCKGVTNCLEEGTTCRGTDIVECAPNADECLVETVTDCTVGGTVNETCDDGSGSPQCVTCTDDPACETATEGDHMCAEGANVVITCADADGDGCLDALEEDCGGDFTCEAGACVYDGDDACANPEEGGACCVEAVLRESGSFPGFATAGAGNDYGGYVCPGLNPDFPYVAAGQDLLFALDVAAGTAALVELVGVDGFSATNFPNLMLLTSCEDGSDPAEETCEGLSRTSVGYANEGSTTVRVYVSVDVDGANTTGSFGLQVDTHPIACGDGIRDGSEACDDGNIFGDDGCTAECTLEEGYECTDTNPSECTRRPEDAVCGNVECAELPGNAPDDAEMCCTTNQRCGISAPYFYGASCLPRDQPGVNDNECPDELGRFFFWPPALSGCCRPDNTCGLSIAGAGCVERTEAWRHMQDGYGVLLYGGPFEEVACTYPEPEEEPTE